MSQLFEKKWPSVILSPISVGNHVITVSSTKGLHPKQLITLTHPSQDPLDIEIKRVLSATEVQVGPRGKSITHYLNPVEFDGGELVAVEQERNVIDANAGIRAAYAEEPTVALRNVLVDYFGNYIDSTSDSNGNNAIAVVAEISNRTNLKPAKYDQVLLTRDPNTKDIVGANFLFQTVSQMKLEMLYDEDGYLIDVREVPI